MNDLSNERIFELYSEFRRGHDNSREELLDRLQDRSTLPRPISPPHRAMRIAATFAATAIVLAFAIPLVMPHEVTLADVEAAVNRQVWIHEKSDDGEESWTCRSLGKRFAKDANGRIQLFDETNYIWMQYLPGDDHIMESRATKKQIEEIKRRNLTRDDLRELRPKPAAYQPLYEREQERKTVDGRELLRFDTFIVDALERRSLHRQLWIDPRTQLPVKSRRWIESQRNGAIERQFVDGVYDFPTTGPASIYEIGVPEGLKIVRVGPPDSDAPLPKDVERILVETRAAQARFPARFRLLVWPNLDDEATSSWSEGVDRIYWNGNPTRTERKNLLTPGLVDWSGVKIRQQRFLGEEGERLVMHGGRLLPESVLSLPKEPPELETWLIGRSSSALRVSDGTRQYTWRPSQKELRIFRINTGPALSNILFPNNYWPREYQWPTLRYGENGSLEVTGDYQILGNPPEDVRGTVAVRLNSRPGQRFDFYLDPAHDYICLKKVVWDRNEGNTVKDHEIDLLNLQQFPSGQWYATQITTTNYRNTAEGTRTSVRKRSIDIKLLNEDEFPIDAFNGDKLLSDAKQKAYTIRTEWAQNVEVP
ncbi:MAG: hypothetical protein CMJ50_09690 [Planctomycetaceae bacterium]|nr:hypothetical protein [Planctomycetaceae bacterium]